VAALKRVSSVVTSRYAKAVLNLATEKKLIEKFESDISDLKTMLDESDDLINVLANPRIAKDVQSKLVAEIAKKAKFQQLTINFLNVLIENRRLNALMPIIKAVQAEIALRRGERLAVVTVAQDMTPKQRKDLQDSLSKSTGANVMLEVKVDESILGGMIVTLDSQMIDDSVIRKLERLKIAMGRGVNQNENENVVQNLSEVV
jgi:F-type H+-transporting ATPase subunit delta